MGSMPSTLDTEESLTEDSTSKHVNALGLSPAAVADILRVMGVVGNDSATHCVQAHIRYFREHPEHLERFCGRPDSPEPMHYSPVELNKDKQFADRSLTHGLALLQVLRCGSGNDRAAMERLGAGLAYAHRGLNLTRDILKDYADIMIEYITYRFGSEMTSSTTAAWRRFMYGIAEAMFIPKESTAFQQYLTLHSPPKPPEAGAVQSVDSRQRLVDSIKYTKLHNPEAIMKTAVWLIQKCQREILQTSPPISVVSQKMKLENPLEKKPEEEPACCKSRICSHCMKVNSTQKPPPE